MRPILFSTILLASILLSGCAHRASPYSFAPPNVPMLKQVEVVKQKQGEPGTQIVTYNLESFEHNSVGAIELVTKFISAYDLAYRETANGRQVYQLPSMVGAIGGVVATAFGGNPDAVLFGGAVGSVAAAGNNYYAPQSKAEMYADAINALICLRQVADGGKAKNVADTIDQVKEFAAIAAQSADMSETELDGKIYRSIENGVLGIRTTLSHRLLSAGQFTDASALADQYKTLVEAQLKAAQEAEDAADELRTARSSAKNAGASDSEKLSAYEASEDLQDKLLDELQAETKICALRAKA